MKTKKALSRIKGCVTVHHPSEIDLLDEWLIEHIRPYYKTFDRCHNEDHFDEVYNAMKLMLKSGAYDKDTWVIGLVAAAYHDTGRIVNDKEHEKYSTKVLSRDMQFKAFMTELFGIHYYDEIMIHCLAAIKHHRHRKKTTIEIESMLQDADKVSHTNKERATRRAIYFYIDKLWNGYDKEEIITDRIKFIGGFIEFKPRSEAGRRIWGPTVIKIDDAYVRKTVDKILEEDEWCS